MVFDTNGTVTRGESSPGRSGEDDYQMNVYFVYQRLDNKKDVRMCISLARRVLTACSASFGPIVNNLADRSGLH